jgi:hypothetical protein
MNIFAVDSDPVIAAQNLCDKHIVCMPKEAAQVLSTVMDRYGAWKEGMNEPYQANGPCALWAGATRGNASWLLAHGFALCEEYTFRYGKTYLSLERLRLIDLSAVPEGPLQPFVQVMPEEYRGSDAVAAYRLFYLRGKIRFAKWGKGRLPPPWYLPMSDTVGSCISVSYV